MNETSTCSPATFRAFAMTIALAGSACDTINDGMVVDGQPDPYCKGCYFSERDNPTIQRWANLRAIDTDVEYARREGDAWVYNNFDLTFKAWSGDPKKGSVNNYDLTPEPLLDMGLWDPTRGDARMPWKVRGLEIGYSRLRATATQYDLYHNPIDVPPIPVMVSLHPNTILVPIQVVRVMPPPASPYYDVMASETYEQWKHFFDDRPDIRRLYRNSRPGGRVNVQVSYRETRFREYFHQADEIFQQCGIQFRMIDCEGSPRGCPDLHVQNDKYVAPVDCGDSIANFPEVRTNWTNAEKLPGVDPLLPIVVLMVRPSGPCQAATPLDVARQGRATFSTEARFASPYTPSHELGHVLGLPDITCRPPNTNLMCQLGLESATLSETQCTAARKVAAEYARRKWGVSITP